MNACMHERMHAYMRVCLLPCTHAILGDQMAVYKWVCTYLCTYVRSHFGSSKIIFQILNISLLLLIINDLLFEIHPLLLLAPMLAR